MPVLVCADGPIDRSVSFTPRHTRRSFQKEVIKDPAEEKTWEQVVVVWSGSGVLPARETRCGLQSGTLRSIRAWWPVTVTVPQGTDSMGCGP